MLPIPTAQRPVIAGTFLTRELIGVSHETFLDINSLIKLLSRLRVPLEDEKRAQACISDALTAAGIEHEREVRLNDRDIIDFVVGGVGIEVKLKGSRMDIYRQVERYTTSKQLTMVVLLTAKSMQLPELINGKPSLSISLSRAWL